MRLPRVLCGAILGVTALAAPALALNNPIVAHIKPIGPGGARGNATLFQIGSNVNIAVTLQRDRKGDQAIGIHKGTCAKYARRPHWITVSIAGTTEQTRFPHAKLQQFLGHVLVVHKTKDARSPAIGCAPITDSGS